MKYWCLNNDIKMKKIIRTSFLMILISSCSEGYIPIEEMTQIPSGPVTYETDISPIISSRCISCHSGNNPQVGLLLENYNQVRNSSENGLLIQRINDPADPMPATGLMPTSTRALFDEWVNNGYLEN